MLILLMGILVLAMSMVVISSNLKYYGKEYELGEGKNDDKTSVSSGVDAVPDMKEEKKLLYNIKLFDEGSNVNLGEINIYAGVYDHQAVEPIGIVPGERLDQTQDYMDQLVSDLTVNKGIKFKTGGSKKFSTGFGVTPFTDPNFSSDLVKELSRKYSIRAEITSPAGS